MRVRVPYFSAALILIVAACGKPDPVAKDANAVTVVPPTGNAAPSAPDGAPPPNAAAATAPPADKVLIPASIQGRWGLTPADCTSPLGDAKGLLVINSGELRFYESRAVPSSGVEAKADSVVGNFDFTGEGQNWTKFETLERQKDKLVRTESNPAASYTYAKC